MQQPGRSNHYKAISCSGVAGGVLKMVMTACLWRCPTQAHDQVLALAQHLQILKQRCRAVRADMSFCAVPREGEERDTNKTQALWHAFIGHCLQPFSLLWQVSLSILLAMHLSGIRKRLEVRS